MSKRTASPPLSFIEPCQPLLVAEPPAGDRWIHEIKHDGYRTMLLVDREQARAFTRNGYDWTERYKPVIVAAALINARTAIIDGEMIVQAEDGRSDFEALAGAIRRAPARLVFFAFDLLHLDGEDLRKFPLIERRALLRELVPADPRSPMQFSEHITGGGPAFFAAVDKMGLEGIVSKRADSLYRSGPSKRWQKIKCWTESEFLVVGAEIDRRGIPVARLARETEQGLASAGAAIIALRDGDRDKLHRAIEKMAGRGKSAPLRVLVKHLKGSGALRHATVRSLA